ncbi:2-dehydropantoate 2-reductase [Cyanobium sp. Alchichica 3B3-8F6]|nr:2-dehydropantoate 2-reductase [Cyanobium sp. Alchichica 3B3-8F6]
MDSPWGDVTVPASQLVGNVRELGSVDGLIVAIKSTANHQLAGLLAGLAAPAAVILLLQNGLGGEAVAEASPGSIVLGGVCDIACSRVAPAHVKHYAAGLIHLAPWSATGEPSDEAQQACNWVADDLRAAGVPIDCGESLQRMRWRKLVWNMAFSGLCVVSGRGTQGVLADAALRDRLERIMQEVVEAAAATGNPLDANVVASFLAQTEAIPDYAPSMQLDARAGRPMELQTIYRNPLQRGQSCGAAMPETAQLLGELEAPTSID